MSRKAKDRIRGASRTIPDACNHEDTRHSRRGIHWIRFPTDILAQLYKLGPTSTIVFCALMGHAYHSALVFPSKIRLHQITGLSRRTVFRALKHLKAIQLVRPGPRHGSVQSIIIVPLLDLYGDFKKRHR